MKNLKEESFHKTLKKCVHAIEKQVHGSVTGIWDEQLHVNADFHFDAYISGAPMDSIVTAITGYSPDENTYDWEIFE